MSLINLNIGTLLFSTLPIRYAMPLFLLLDQNIRLDKVNLLTVDFFVTLSGCVTYLI